VQFPHDGFSPFWVGFTPDGKKLLAVETGDEGKGKIMAWDFTPVTK
jgi:hypothetical protein